MADNDDKKLDNEVDKYLTTPEEAIDVDNVSPEERRGEYQEREGREVDGIPRPSDDGDDYDDSGDPEDREP